MPQRSTLSMLRRMIGDYLRPYARPVAVALLFMVLSAGLTAAFARLIQPVLDDLLVERRADLVVPMAMAVLGVFIAGGLATYVHTVLMSRIGQSVVADVQKDLFSRLLDLDLRFFHQNPSGQLVARMISDVQAMRAAMVESLTGIGESLMTLIFLMALMFSIDSTLTLIALCVFPPAALFVAWIGRRLRKVSRRIQGEIGDMSDNLSQVFLGMRQVKAYGTEDFERRRVGTIIDGVLAMFLKSYRIANLSTPVNQTLLGLTLGGVIIYGGKQAVMGQMTPGELMSFITAFSLSYEPLKKLAKLNNNIQMGLGAAERVFDMIDRRPEIKDKSNAAPLSGSRFDIHFDNVSFSYGVDDGHALRGVSFRAPAGQVTALVGASGSGKTTAMNLVPRLYDATGGRVLIGGRDVRDVSIESLRRHIALVSQDITIFDDTVSANIAYGTPGASAVDIEAAARAAAADFFIRDLTQGYDTRLGENGVLLSGGQRQRIAIARAILRNAPILLLDEATSALDNESERAIQASLERLQQGRTTLVIAHRLTTVRRADHIVVLDKGVVAEQGTHDTLLAHDGAYARMIRAGFAE